MGEEDARREWLKCRSSVIYFIHTYCNIYDATSGTWIPFALWPEQARTLKTVLENNLVVILKARQLGQTWLMLCFALWLMIFRPSKTVLLFSRRDDEAMYLMERLRGVYKRLPDWCKARNIKQDSAHIWELSNGSIAYAFPTTAGDSYTASLAIVDEADLVPDLDRLMNAVKPTIDGGGRMILLSRTDKSNPSSAFKRIYRAAKAGQNPWAHVFLPWFSRPDRTAEWYEAQKRDVYSRTGSLDDLFQQYPATDAEALSANSMDKRFPNTWLEQCLEPLEPINVEMIDGPSLPTLLLYELPTFGEQYVVGVDPAEGNPTSDDSALTIVRTSDLAEVASLRGKIEPSMMAAYAVDLAMYFNDAGIMVERNNHGHSVILEIRNLSEHARILAGWDDRPGWLSSSRGKVILYNHASDIFRDKVARIRTTETFMQLGSIEGTTLRAPDGLHDDLADSFALALVGATYAPTRTVVYSYA